VSAKEKALAIIAALLYLAFGLASTWLGKGWKL
jgi:hypothetical protein